MDPNRRRRAHQSCVWFRDFAGKPGVLRKHAHHTTAALSKRRKGRGTFQRDIVFSGLQIHYNPICISFIKYVGFAKTIVGRKPDLFEREFHRQRKHLTMLPGGSRPGNGRGGNVCRYLRRHVRRGRPAATVCKNYRQRFKII